MTGDTGPMHLAAAVGTPVVGIFGPTDPARYAPLINQSAAVHANLWCRPCHRTRRPPARCRHGAPDCLVGVGTGDVVAAVRSLLVPGAGSRFYQLAVPGLGRPRVEDQRTHPWRDQLSR